MAEEVLIKIELEKGSNEKEVDAMTRKITDLTKANNELKKSNNELIKSGQENSKEFIENTRQMEINKQKIQEATSSRKNLITTLIAEDDSIKGLKARNAELIKQRDQLSTSTQAGRDAIAKINAELDKNNKAIIDNSSALEKQRFNVGNYKSALDGLVPGLGGFVDGIQSATKAAIAFITTPLGAILGAIGLALSAVTAYFKGSEEGQNKFNRLVSIGSAVLEQFMNVLEDVGGFIVEVFENPQQAIKDFGNLIVENLTNRFEGFLEFIPKISEAISLLFEGEFAKAGQVALDATAKVVLGVENATEKIGEFINETVDLVNQGIENGERLAELNARIDKEERALIQDRARTALEVAQIRAKAVELEGEAKKAAIEEAIKLEEDLAARETKLAKDRLALAELEVKANGDDKEALKAVAEARAEVFNAEAAAFTNTLKLRKELHSLSEQEQKDAEAAAKLQAELEKEQFENNLKALEIQTEQRSNELKERYLNEQLSKEEFETQMTAIELLALEERKAFLVANGEETLAIETAIVDQQIKIKEAQAAREKQLLKERDVEEKKKLDNERAITQAKIGLLGSFGSVLQQFAGKNKALAIAAVIVQKAAAVAQIIAHTAIANAEAVSTFWLTAGMPWVAINTAQAVLSIASVVGEAASSISQINSAERAKRGMILKRKAAGGMLVGASHAQGGIPFTINGTPGFEAEGGEAIINKKSTQAFKPLLSRINQWGGGVAFSRGAIFQTGSVVASTQTRAASQVAETRTQMRDSLLFILENQPPTIVTVEDINNGLNRVADQVNRAVIA